APADPGRRPLTYTTSASDIPFLQPMNAQSTNGAPSGTDVPGPHAPLPLRGDRAERPTPAGGLAAVPPQSPRTPARPQLPKRRAQEHLVPQLRDEPTARKDEEHALHDPGLMAAFQRGIGLAESQSAPQHPEALFEASRDPLAAPHDPLRHDDAHKE
ncbi:MAG TPA: ATP-binding protein, partial [Streptomyces sp.]